MTHKRPNYPGLESFCFPESISTKPTSKSSNKFRFCDYHLNPDNHFVFKFTNENYQYYGICIYKIECIEVITNKKKKIFRLIFREDLFYLFMNNETKNYRMRL